MSEYIIKETGYPEAIELEVVQELVRCRDCKHYKFTNDYAFGFPEKGCELTGFNDVDEDDFCSRGWRKDGKQ